MTRVRQGRDLRAASDAAALLAVSVRGPRPDANDNHRRASATKLAITAIAAGYGMTEAEVQELPEMAAMILDDERTFQGESMNDDERLSSKCGLRCGSPSTASSSAI